MLAVDIVLADHHVAEQLQRFARAAGIGHPCHLSGGMRPTERVQGCICAVIFHGIPRSERRTHVVIPDCFQVIQRMLVEPALPVPVALADIGAHWVGKGLLRQRQGPRGLGKGRCLLSEMPAPQIGHPHAVTGLHTVLRSRLKTDCAVSSCVHKETRGKATSLVTLRVQCPYRNDALTLGFDMVHMVVQEEVKVGFRIYNPAPPLLGFAEPLQAFCIALNLGRDLADDVA